MLRDPRAATGLPRWQGLEPASPIVASACRAATACGWHVLRNVVSVEATMGRAFKAVRTRTLEGLFPYFGLDVEPDLVATHREAIEQRFGAEVQEIVRLCSGLREKERFTILRAALRLSYESAVAR